jgi:hypothetical protein
MRTAVGPGCGCGRGERRMRQSQDKELFADFEFLHSAEFDLPSIELRVFAARSRRRSSVGRTRGVGERVGLWRFHPGRSLSGAMIAGHEARSERHDARITAGSLPLCTVVIWGRVRGIGLCGDSGSPWRAGTQRISVACRDTRQQDRAAAEAERHRRLLRYREAQAVGFRYEDLHSIYRRRSIADHRDRRYALIGFADSRRPVLNLFNTRPDRVQVFSKLMGGLGRMIISARFTGVGGVEWVV